MVARCFHFQLCIADEVTQVVDGLSPRQGVAAHSLLMRLSTRRQSSLGIVKLTPPEAFLTANLPPAL
jgi:hypothetical protein